MKLWCHALCALILTSVAAHAVPLTPRVVDENGKPVAGAAVEYIDLASATDEPVRASNNARTASDGTLALDLRGIAPGPPTIEIREGNRTVVGGARVRAAGTGYGATLLFAGDNQLVTGAVGSVRGAIRDATGKPLSGAIVKLWSVEKSKDDFSDASATHGLPPIIAVSGVDGAWQIDNLPRGYASFLVSAPNAALDGLKLRLDKAVTVAPDLKLRAAGAVKGRILDFGGRPLKGVAVKLEDDYGDFARSDEDGRFVVPKVPVGTNALEFYGSFELSNVWMGVTDTVKATIPRQGATVDVGEVRADQGLLVSGAVFDAQTKAPIPLLQLSVIGRGMTLTTDAQGRFEARVPKPFWGLSVPTGYEEQGITIDPPDGATEFDMGAILVNQPFRLRPEAIGAPPVIVDPLVLSQAEKAWDALKVEQVYDLNRYLPWVGARRVFEAARRHDAGANPRQIGEGLDNYLAMRARSARTPAQREEVASEGYQLLRPHAVGGWSFGMADIAVLCAHSDDAELREWAGKWYDAQKSRVRKPDSPDKLQWYHIALTERMMQVGAALERPDALTYREIWLHQIDVPNNSSLETARPDWGETLWRADPRWFEEIVGQWPVPQQMLALSGALESETDATQARALLARVEALAKSPQTIAADASRPEKRIPLRDEFLYEARFNFARSMASVDAPAALDALDDARKVVASDEVFDIAFSIARTAIAQGQTELARRALRLGLLDTSTGGVGAPALAMLARSFDAELAAQLMNKARQNATRDSGDVPGWSDVAAYAFALREFDADMGLLMLENQWALRQQLPDGLEAEDSRAGLIVGQEKLAWAMAVYDLPRALQWLSEIKDDRNESNNGIERTRREILASALTPPAERPALLSSFWIR